MMTYSILFLNGIKGEGGRTQENVWPDGSGGWRAGCILFSIEQMFLQFKDQIVAGEQVVDSFECSQNPKNQRMAVFDWPRRCHSSVELFMLIFVC